MAERGSIVSEPGGLQSGSNGPVSDTSPEAQRTMKPLALSAAQLEQRQMVAVKHGLYATENATKLRARKVRKMAKKELAAAPWLTPSDLPLVKLECEVRLIRDLVLAELHTRGVVGKTGQPKRLLAELDRLNNTLLRIRAQLPRPPESSGTSGLDAEGRIPIALVRQILQDAEGDTEQRLVREARQIIEGS